VFIQFYRNYSLLVLFSYEPFQPFEICQQNGEVNLMYHIFIIVNILVVLG